MDKLTYKQAEDLIFQAYFNDEIKPFHPSFCFCGTLSPDERWEYSGTASSLLQYPYTRSEYGKMEQALFSTFPEYVWLNICAIEDVPDFDNEEIVDVENYEEKLFAGMCAALEVLKYIHISRGEIIDEPVPFKQRKLVAA